MTALEKIRTFVAEYPGYDILGRMHVDYTDQIPGNGGIFPAGLSTRTVRDVTGGASVIGQYNFGIYCVLEKAPGDDAGAAVNADWVMGFQEWVLERSCSGTVPQFGEETMEITAQNGVLYESDEEGTATYMVQLSVSFEKG